MLISSSLGSGASPCRHHERQSSLTTRQYVKTARPTSEWSAGTNLELLWQVECNSVILLSRLEVCCWLHKSDHRRSHADLDIVYIVSRDVSE